MRPILHTKVIIKLPTHGAFNGALNDDIDLEIISGIEISSGQIKLTPDFSYLSLQFSK